MNPIVRAVKLWVLQTPERVPYRTPFMLRKHRDETGVIVCGRWIALVPGDAWADVVVRYGEHRRGQVAVLATRGRRCWFELPPGSHTFEFTHQRAAIFETTVHVAQGEIWMISFRVPVAGFRLWPKREAMWSVRRLRPLVRGNPAKKDQAESLRCWKPRVGVPQ